MRLEAILELVGRESGREAAAKARPFAWFVVFHATVDEWISVANLVPVADTWTVASSMLTHPRSTYAYAMSVALFLVCVPKLRRLGFLLAPAVLLAVIVFVTFPYTANHGYLYVVVLTLIASFDTEDEDERLLLLQGCRLVMASVLFYAGLKKVMFGTYFGGEMFAFLLTEGPRFAALGWVLPAWEMESIRQVGPAAHGSGPYRLTSPAGLVLSNVAYLAEIGIAVGLLFPATRTLCAVGAIASIAFIEIFAREVPFGIFFTTLALLFLPARFLRLGIFVFVILDAVMVLTRLAIVPWWDFV